MNLFEVVLCCDCQIPPQQQIPQQEQYSLVSELFSPHFSFNMGVAAARCNASDSEICACFLGYLEGKKRAEDVTNLFRAATKNVFFVAHGDDDDDDGSGWETTLQALIKKAFSSANLTQRVPIGINTGRPGSGKTMQLLWLGDRVERLKLEGVAPAGMSALYVTVNGPNNAFRDYDNAESVQVRVALRILHATVGDVGYDRFFTGVCNWCTSHGVNVRDVSQPSVLRSVLKVRLRLEKPLLILFDELRMLDSAAVPGLVSKIVTEALHFLGNLTQASFESEEACPILVVASALAAIDPMMAETESGREVIGFRLPPLPVTRAASGLFKKRKMSLDHQIAARRALWSSQFNALVFGRVMRRLCDGEDAFVMEEELRVTALAEADDAVRKFHAACDLQKQDPASLFCNLFWAFRRAAARGTMHESMVVACIAEACGLCKIMPGMSEDSVYFHPVFLARLASSLDTRTQIAPVNNVVRALAEALQAAAVPPQAAADAAPAAADAPRAAAVSPPATETNQDGGNSRLLRGPGKLYEEIIHLLYLGRYLTTPPPSDLNLELFLGGETHQALRNVTVRVEPLDSSGRVEVFPRCAGNVPPRPELGLELKASRRVGREADHHY